MYSVVLRSTAGFLKRSCRDRTELGLLASVTNVLSPEELTTYSTGGPVTHAGIFWAITESISRSVDCRSWLPSSDCPYSGVTRYTTPKPRGCFVMSGYPVLVRTSVCAEPG